MIIYKDVDGDSGVEGYEIGKDYIAVTFKQGVARGYLYNHAITGVQHVEEMKRLASDGDGLNSYINKYVKKRYARKI